MRWNVAEYQRTVFEQVQLRFTGSERVLDLGCGDGADAAWLAQRVAATVAVDLVAHPRWEELARPNLTFRVQNGEALPFPSESFDLVFLKDVLHHAEAPAHILDEVRRVCAPQGRVCIVEANRLNPVFYIHMTLMLGHQHFRRPYFQALVRDVFPTAKFIHFEAHVYPFTAKPLVALTRGIQWVIGRVPPLNRFAAYNAAIVMRS